jgi:GT2 family glycosyltransferase
VHEAGENRGISSRNKQAELARGKYLFSFDDDTIPGSPAMILRIVQYLEARPDIDALNATYYQPLTGVTETQGWELFRNGGNSNIGYEGIFIVEGGVCFRLDSLRRVEGYDRAFLVYSEGMELGIQLFKAGRHMYVCPWFLTLHFAAQSMRPPGLRAYANSRHMVWIIAKHWPVLMAIPLLVCLIGRRALGMLMHTETRKENARGLIDGFRGIIPFIRRKPKLTWKQILKLKRFYLFFFRWV